MRLSVERKLLGGLHKAKVLYITHKFLNSLWQPEAFMLENSAQPETLFEIIRRQGYKRYLTIISDDVFQFFKLLYGKLKCAQTFQHIKQNPKSVLQAAVEKLEFAQELSEAFCNLFSSYKSQCECESVTETTSDSDVDLEIDTVLDYELEETLILLYMSKVHLSDLTSKMLDMLDTILQKEKTFQLRHSLGSATKKSDVVPKVVDFPCGTCGKECIELASVETSPFEDWSIQCDKCDIWYYLVCQNLTGQEPELQPKSWKKFFCTACKPTGKGKGHGKSSTVSVTAQQNIENFES